MELTLSGEIIKIDYDNVVDIERVEFRDKKLNMDGYIEIPRLSGELTFVNVPKITVTITDSDKKPPKDTKVVFNTTLYMVRKTAEEIPKNVVQFSSGGTILRIMNTGSSPFRLRGNRSYKIIVS